MEIIHLGLLIEMALTHGHYNNTQDCAVATSTKYTDEIWIGEFITDTHAVLDFWGTDKEVLASYNIKYLSSAYCTRSNKKSISGLHLTFIEGYESSMTAEQYKPYY